MKVIDCFPYFNEEEHLILRINLLKDYVDQFVICEANRTHTGNLKEYTVEQVLERNGILLDKVRIFKVELPSKEQEPDNWVRERKQRDEVAKLIQEDEIWFISDCDEIINPKYLDWFKQVVVENPKNIVRVRMTFLIGQANFQLFYKDSPLYWDTPYFVLKKHIDKYTLSEIRECVSWDRSIEFPSIFITEDDKVVEAGWHLSWMGSSDRRVKKLESFMHYNDFLKNGIGQLDTQETRNYVSGFVPIESSIDILGRQDHSLKNYDTGKLPYLIFQNTKLKDFFLPNQIPHTYTNDSFGENWFTYPNLYRQMVLRFGSGSIFVEIGSWKGRSSSYMATEIANSKKEIKFFCIDTWEGSKEHKPFVQANALYDTFLHNMRPLEKFYTPIKLSSLLASEKFEDESIDFLFLDGSHEYEDVKQDIASWWPKIKKGGVFAGHDYYQNPEWGGVKKAVDEFFTDHKIETQEQCFIILK